MERLPNYDNFRQLYEFYTTKGGMNPAQASGMLGNIYAESRANTAAINPGDGRDGSDSIGIIQWNSGRADALRTFAQQRETTANDLLTQAEFTLMEGKGVERKGFNQGMAGQTPEEAALGFASGYIRPAAQHIPQRAEYGRMMYDIFAGGNPNGVQPGLAYNPQQAERLSREREAIANGEAQPMSYGKDMEQRYSGSSLQDIVAKLMESANPQIQQEQGFASAPAQPPYQAPAIPQIASTRPEAPGQSEGAGTAGLRDFAPILGENAGESLPTPSGPDSQPTAAAPPPEQQLLEQIDTQFPAADGERPTSEIITENLVPIAEESAYNLGVPIEDAPTTARELAQAASEPEPDPDDESEEAKKKRNRRLVAADMLEVLSVGLGQMAAGQAVNVGPQLQGQRNRYAEQLAQGQAQEQQQAQAQTLAKELTAMGMPGMARVALSGPEGFKQAMDTLGTVKGRAPATQDGFKALSRDQRKEVLRSAGFSEQETAFFSQPGLEDLAADAIKAQTMPDPQQEKEQAGVNRELTALAGLAGPLRDNPEVMAAASSAFANPTQANTTAFRDALAKAGADVTSAAQDGPAGPLSDAEAAFYEGVATPEQIAAAKADPGLADAIRTAGNKGLVAGAEKQGQLKAETAVTEAQVKGAVAKGVIPAALEEYAMGAGMDEAVKLEQKMRDEAKEQQDRIRVGANAKAFGRAYSNPEASALFEGIQTVEELNSAIRTANELYGVPDKIKALEMLSGNQALMGTEIALRHATAGVRLNQTQERILGDTLDRFNTKRQTLDTRVPLIEGMNLLIEQISAEGYDRSSGGPLEPIFAKLQNLSTQLGLGIDLQDDPVNFVQRLFTATSGEFFQNFRLAGSGATSDKESTNFEQAMPQGSDSAIKQLGMAQRIVRSFELQNKAMELEQQWMLENANDPTKQLNETAKTKFVEDGIAALGINIFPTVDMSSENWVEQMGADWDSGNLTRETVVRSVNANGEAEYVMFGDFADALGVKLQ